MKQQLRVSLCAALLAVCVMTVGNTQPVAASTTVSGYATGATTAGTYTITDDASANTYLSAACATGADPAVVAGYPSNIALNEVTGALTYQANVLWRSCGTGATIYAFAIIGYPNDGAGGLATCPLAGTYGDGVNPTYDCVKYTGGFSPATLGLSCSLGTGYVCVNGGSNPSGMFVGTVQRTAIQPPTATQVTRLNLTGQVPAGAIASLSGSYQFVRDYAFCTYYNYGYGGSDRWGNCVNMVINVAWLRYNYSLTPFVAIDNSRVTPGQSVQATPRVENAGPTVSNNTAWQLVRFSVPPGQTHGTSQPSPSNSTAPCAYFTYGSGTCTTIANGTRSFPVTSTTLSSTSNTVNEPIGSLVCYATSVQTPTHNASPTWRHSAPACVIVAKTPTVTVTGGDVRVGRSTSSPATIVTSRFGDTTHNYGAWAEYGLLAPGEIDSVSGALLATDSSRLVTYAGPRTALTFANTASSAGLYGNNSTGQLSDLSSYYRTHTSWQHDTSNIPTITDLAAAGPGSRVITVTTSDGDVTLDHTAPPLGSGVSRLLEVPETVTISHDIVYDNSAVSNSAQLPQLIIHAKNIIITDSVQRIDAWLIADDTISTCGAAIAAPGSYYDGLTSSTCTQQLTVNGPIQAAHLQLRRTHGADGTTDAERSTPAEQFNFRSDAYLWARGQARDDQNIRTMALRERAPRF